MKIAKTKSVEGNEVRVKFEYPDRSYTLIYDLELDSAVDIGLNLIGLVSGRKGLYARYHRDSKYGALAVSTIVARTLNPGVEVHSCQPLNGDSLDVRKSNLRVITKVAHSGAHVPQPSKPAAPKAPAAPRAPKKPKDNASVVKSVITPAFQVGVSGSTPDRCSIAHQKIIKDRTREEDLQRFGQSLFDAGLSEYTFATEQLTEEIKSFILRYEWLGTVGVKPKWVFTARVRDVLSCVVCINEPNAYSDLLGPGTRNLEALIQRGASASFAHEHVGSKLIRWSCNWMVKNTNKRVFFGYSDPSGGEVGIIYQACGFDYLGSSFGAKKMYTHPEFGNGKVFTAQSLRRTSLWKKLYRKWHGKPLPSEFLSANGFKNMKKVEEIDPAAKREFYDWGNRIIREANVIDIPSKGKYVLVLGPDRREQVKLNALIKYRKYPYPKRG